MPSRYFTPSWNFCTNSRQFRNRQRIAGTYKKFSAQKKFNLLCRSFLRLVIEPLVELHSSVSQLIHFKFILLLNCTMNNIRVKKIFQHSLYWSSPPSCYHYSTIWICSKKLQGISFITSNVAFSIYLFNYCLPFCYK